MQTKSTCQGIRLGAENGSFGFYLVSVNQGLSLPGSEAVIDHYRYALESQRLHPSVEEKETKKVMKEIHMKTTRKRSSHPTVYEFSFVLNLFSRQSGISNSLHNAVGRLKEKGT